MKKILAFLLVFGLCGAALFAQGFSLSAGAGGMFDAFFSSTKIADQDPSKSNSVGGGLYAFFDATYAEIDLDLLFSSYDADPDNKDDGSTALTYFGISVLGKYPIALSEQVTLFPLLGIDYQAFLSGQMKDKDGEKVGDESKRGDDAYGDYKVEDMLDAFSIAVGVGADFGLTEQLYLRGEFLWNFKLDNKSEAENRKDAKDANVDYSLFTSGPRIKLAVGFKF
jgi:hypothetical protein